MSSKEYGQILRRKRLSAGVTIARYAELTGTDPAVLAKIEDGKFDPPLSVALKLASGLGWVIR